MSEPDVPAVSVVIVIDYKVGNEGAWDDLRLTLEGLRRQTFEGSAEFLLVEPVGATLELPAELQRLLPSLSVVHVEAATSYDLKNAGAEAARSQLVAILDGDCVPHPDWLRSMVRHHQAHPDAAAISGRTLYRAGGFLARAFALLDRSYVDCGGPGRNRAISNNNAAFRRDALMRFPLRNDIGTFGSKMHSDRMLAAGLELRFEPDMVAYHQFDGWRMQRLARRHMGFAMARYRMLEDDVSHGWMFRMGMLGVPVVFAMAVAGSWKRCLKRAGHYGVRWFEVPAVMAVAIPVHALELPGVVRALRNREMVYGDGYV